MCKHRVISGPYFPVFSPNTGKYGPEIPPHLDTFHSLKADPTQIPIHYFWKMLLRNSKENDDNWIFPIFFTFTPLFSLEIETEGRGGGEWSLQRVHLRIWGVAGHRTERSWYMSPEIWFMITYPSVDKTKVA